jgi:hypothetical protein
MKNTLLCFFCFHFFLFFSQEKKTFSTKSTYLQLDYTYGNIVTQKGIDHLLTGNTESVFLSWNKRTFGEKNWHQLFNYPDLGYSFVYQDLKNDYFGELYGVFGHYNFYLLKRNFNRNLILTIGTGIAYITNPYHKINNNKNIAIGSHLNSSSYIKLFYRKEKIIDRIGLQAGFSFLHASNASIKAPNKGVNVWGLNLGLNYDLDDSSKTYKVTKNARNYREPIKFNLALYGGFNESDFIDIGSFPFMIFSAFLDKRLDRKSALQFGAELHLHYSVKESNKFYYIFNGDVTNNTYHYWKRDSVFIGYELFINKTSIFSQIGYYVYSPEIQEENIYERIGAKRYLNTNFFASLSIKAHILNAEGLEFGIGYRF